MRTLSWGPFDLTGKAAIVTGGARGIGLACARGMRRAGAHVMIADVDPEASARAVEELVHDDAPGQVSSCPVDVAEPDAADSTIRRCVEELGSIDVLVNNAGIYPTAHFADMSPDFVHRVMSVNVEGLIQITRTAALRMINDGTTGAIVNMASIGALRGLHPGLVAYGASKGAVMSFTTRAAGALARYGIRVNAIAPGTIDTHGAAELRSRSSTADESSAIALAAAAVRVPLGRAGRPDDIGPVAVFLASDAARYITGVTVVVDGGEMLA